MSIDVCPNMIKEMSIDGFINIKHTRFANMHMQLQGNNMNNSNQHSKSCALNSSRFLTPTICTHSCVEC